MRTVWLVASREFTERLRSKAFVISNLIIVTVILAAVLLPALLAGGDEPTVIATVGADAAEVAAVAAASADALDLDVEVVDAADREAAEALLTSRDVEVAILDATTVLVEGWMSPRLESLLAGAVNALQVDAAMAAAGIDDATRRALLDVPRLEVERLEDDAAIDVFEPSILVVYGAVFLLYGLLVVYGQWVAQGIVEEKQSRVVEVLLASLRPSELLGGKVLGLGALGVAQILLFAVIGGGALLVTEVIEIPASSWLALALVLPWFLLGYLLYAALFAMSGAMVSRVEDLQSAVMPVILVLVGALLVAQFAIADPTTTIARVAGIVPLTAPIVQPILLAAGMEPGWEVAVSILLALVLIAVLIPVAGRIYRGGVLRTRGRVSIREAIGAVRGR